MGRFSVARGCCDVPPLFCKTSRSDLSFATDFADADGGIGRDFRRLGGTPVVWDGTTNVSAPPFSGNSFALREFKGVQAFELGGSYEFKLVLGSGILPTDPGVGFVSPSSQYMELLTPFGNIRVAKVAAPGAAAGLGGGATGIPVDTDIVYFDELAEIHQPAGVISAGDELRMVVEVEGSQVRCNSFFNTTLIFSELRGLPTTNSGGCALSYGVRTGGPRHDVQPKADFLSVGNPNRPDFWYPSFFNNANPANMNSDWVLQAGTPVSLSPTFIHGMFTDFEICDPGLTTGVIPLTIRARDQNGDFQYSGGIRWSVV